MAMTFDLEPVEQYRVPRAQLDAIQKSFSADRIAEDKPIKPPAKIETATGACDTNGIVGFIGAIGGKFISVLSEPGRRQVCYKLVKADEFGDDTFVYEQGIKSRRRVEQLADRHEGFYHGCQVKSRNRVHVLMGPAVEFVLDDPTQDDATGTAPAEEPSRPIANPGQRPANLSNIDGIDEKLAQDILAAIESDVADDLRQRGRELVQAYVDACEEQGAAPGVDDKKLRYNFNFSGSIQSSPTGTFLTDVKLAFATKKTCRHSTEVGLNIVAGNKSFFSGKTSDYTDPPQEVDCEEKEEADDVDLDDADNSGDGISNDDE